MNNNTPESFRFSINLDQMKKKHEIALKNSFPGISQWAVDRNLAFIELLNDYNWPSFMWIYNFLEEKWYVVESINMNTSNKKPYSREVINRITSWKLLIWFKVFIEKYNTPDQDILVYDILAKKKNKIDFEKIKDSISDIISWKSFSSKEV